MVVFDRDFVDWIIDEAHKMGADEVECYALMSKIYNVTIQAGEVRLPTFSIEKGLGIRVVTDKRIGFASTNFFEKEKIRMVIERALSIARSSKQNPKWVSLPQESKYPHVDKIYDKKLEEMTPEEIMERTKNMLSSAMETDKRVMPVWGGVAVASFEEIVANSHNIYGEKKGTAIAGFLGVIAREGNVTTPMHMEQGLSRTAEIDLDKVGKVVAEKAVRSLKITKIETGEYPIVLDPEAFFMLSLYTLTRALSAELVQTGRSPFANKIGQEIASPLLTIIDDGTLPGGVASAPFDDEGVEMQRNVLIDRGVLKGYMFDNYRAQIENRKSTGNAVRGGVLFEGTQPKYQFTPTITPTNTIIDRGDASLDEIIEEIDKGVLILGVQGAHSSNPETGEISVVATPAWVIENGEIKGQAPGIMMNTNIYEAIKQIESISKETKQTYNMIAPWIKISRVKIIKR